jgi:Na+/H+-translocating membrane pyrophosphatase
VLRLLASSDALDAAGNTTAAIGKVRTCLLYWYQSACFTGPSVLMLTPEELLQGFAIGSAALGTQFSCFTGTKVQILTQKVLLKCRLP